MHPRIDSKDKGQGSLEPEDFEHFADMQRLSSHDRWRSFLLS